MTSPRKYTILFVCTGNTCRSPMAEYALRSLLDSERPGLTMIGSAGTFGQGGHPATDYAVEAGKSWDLDMTPHRSQLVTVELIEAADLILAMAPDHHREVVNLVKSAAGRTCLFKSFPDTAPQGARVDDPIGQSLEQYNHTFLEIGEYLGQYLPDLLVRIDGVARG